MRWNDAATERKITNFKLSLNVYKHTHRRTHAQFYLMESYETHRAHVVENWSGLCGMETTEREIWMFYDMLCYFYHHFSIGVRIHLEFENLGKFDLYIRRWITFWKSVQFSNRQFALTDLQSSRINTINMFRVSLISNHSHQIAWPHEFTLSSQKKSKNNRKVTTGNIEDRTHFFRLSKPVAMVQVIRFRLSERIYWLQFDIEKDLCSAQHDESKFKGYALTRRQDL